MAKSEAKKQRTEPEKPRKNPNEPRANPKGDGLAHDVTVRDIETISDLERNPGIGASKGTTMSGADADDLEAEMSEAENFQRRCRERCRQARRWRRPQAYRTAQ